MMNTYALCVYWTHTRARLALARQLEQCDVARAWAVKTIIDSGVSERDTSNALLLDEHRIRELIAAAPEEEPPVLASVGLPDAARKRT